ncbi:hypothetical protein NEAUS07_1263 [Nematocida ausubeli]|nr:hypothetical protein NEAUS07_1263 [Nematocida ausubeli]
MTISLRSIEERNLTEGNQNLDSSTSKRSDPHILLNLSELSNEQPAGTEIKLSFRVDEVLNKIKVNEFDYKNIMTLDASMEKHFIAAERLRNSIYFSNKIPHETKEYLSIIAYDLALKSLKSSSSLAQLYNILTAHSITKEEEEYIKVHMTELFIEDVHTKESMPTLKNLLLQKINTIYPYFSSITDTLMPDFLRMHAIYTELAVNAELLREKNTLSADLDIIVAADKLFNSKPSLKNGINRHTSDDDIDSLFPEYWERIYNSPGYEFTEDNMYDLETNSTALAEYCVNYAANNPSYLNKMATALLNSSNEPAVKKHIFDIHNRVNLSLIRALHKHKKAIFNGNTVLVSIIDAIHSLLHYSVNEVIMKEKNNSTFKCEYARYNKKITTGLYNYLYNLESILKTIYASDLPKRALDNSNHIHRLQEITEQCLKILKDSSAELLEEIYSAGHRMTSEEMEEIEDNYTYYPGLIRDLIAIVDRELETLSKAQIKYIARTVNPYTMALEKSMERSIDSLGKNEQIPKESANNAGTSIFRSVSLGGLGALSLLISTVSLINITKTN